MSFKLRGRQPEWLAQIHEDLKTRSRILCIAPGGVGKTTLFAALAKDMWDRGIRTLVLENRDRLTEQTAERIRKETGLEVDVEKADQRASPYAAVVVACVQSYSKVARLTGFAPDHFGLVVVDECHLCLSVSWLRVIFYHHFGAESLVEGWVRPPDGPHLAKVVGFTASPDLGSRRNLGELFQGPKPTINYSFLDAIEEGWLVGIKEINAPVRIDTRKFRVKKSAEGDEFNSSDQSTAFTPEIIEKLADQIVEHGSRLKGMCFMPSVDVARQMAETLNRKGIRAIFVSGECIDKSEKTDEFASAPRGTWLINCCLYTYGVDFPDVDGIAPFGAIISKVKYVQIIYRGTRVLPGVVSDGMTAADRLAAIAASDKKELTVISPFYISERIHICEPFDLFGIPPEGKKARKKPDLTKPAEIRDYIEALENEMDKHKNKQPRTVNPVVISLALGIKYTPQTSSEAAPPSRDMLDFLLGHGISTVDVKTAGQASLLVDRLRERQRLGLCSPKQLQFLKILGIPEDKAVLMKAGHAGAIIGRRR